VNDSVSMPAQGTTRGAESERFGWRELKTGGNKLLARALLEVVSAIEDLASLRGARVSPTNRIGSVANTRARQLTRQDTAVVVRQLSPPPSRSRH